ncbi:MAG TPA: inorganic phosphate transporter [Flavobacterium sp.]|uniref:inorganic phosphate transporter n=1 Tax=Flavobacterium sp. TaxID=239 RepID=UPI002C31F01E|nr:inorganic phosphate transporter [Flavobacterium sp.]HNP32898.1 inorganic phosphate transporter [Flavobacterium sp.]
MTLLIVIIVLALIFDYINGFHDAANAIATIVATKGLTPFQAVLWAAFFNFLAFWVFGFGVADTVAKTADTMQIDLVVILAGVVAAIIWNLLTWALGIPSSSSHTLIGGFAGAAIAHALSVHGFSDYYVLDESGKQITKHWYEIVNWYSPAKDGGLPTGVLVIICFIALAPVIGLLLSYFLSLWLMYSSRKSIYPKLFTLAFMGLTYWFIACEFKLDIDEEHARIKSSHFLSIIAEPNNIKWLIVGIIITSISIFCLRFSSLAISKSNSILKKMQLLTSASFSLGHGGNDSQKVMGIIAAAVMVYVHKSGISTDSLPGWLHVDIGKGTMPDWIPLACYSAIALGTLSGGWKIVKTMGSKITKVTAFEGVVAETAGALTLFLTEHFKIPVSTTHTITGSIIGVGVTKRISAVRWGVTVKLLWAWVLTIPVSAVLAAFVYYFLKLFL